MAEWQRGWRGPAYTPPVYSFYYHTAKPPKVNPPKPRKVRKMIQSQVHWCEYGGTGHPFSSKDPDKEHIVRSKETGKTTQYGEAIVEDEEFYLCGKHANGLFRDNTETAAKEIPGTVQD